MGGVTRQLQTMQQQKTNKVRSRTTLFGAGRKDPALLCNIVMSKLKCILPLNSDKTKSTDCHPLKAHFCQFEQYS